MKLIATETINKLVDYGHHDSQNLFVIQVAFDDFCANFVLQALDHEAAILQYTQSPFSQISLFDRRASLFNQIPNFNAFLDLDHIGETIHYTRYLTIYQAPRNKFSQLAFDQLPELDGFPLHPRLAFATSPTERRALIIDLSQLKAQLMHCSYPPHSQCVLECDIERATEIQQTNDWLWTENQPCQAVT